MNTIKRQWIKASNFSQNSFDQVDLDYSDGVVSDSIFVNKSNKQNSGGDGLDVSGSALTIKNNIFRGFTDKAISIGEKANVIITENNISKNFIGIAIKDGSSALLTDNEFTDNQSEVETYIKKKIYLAPKVTRRSK